MINQMSNDYDDDRTIIDPKYNTNLEVCNKMKAKQF